MKNKVYCLNCNTDNEYIVKEEKRTFKVKDLTICVSIKKAFCSNCGEEVFPYEIAKQNDLIVYDEYRRQKHLLTSAEIKGIRLKRKMSQVELARFINCGEKNIARYENGTIQDAVFDNLIRMVGDDYCFSAMKSLKEKEEAQRIEETRFDCSYNPDSKWKLSSITYNETSKRRLGYGKNKHSLAAIPC